MFGTSTETDANFETLLLPDVNWTVLFLLAGHAKYLTEDWYYGFTPVAGNEAATAAEVILFMAWCKTFENNAEAKT